MESEGKVDVRTGRAGNDQVANLDVDIRDNVFCKKCPSLGGNDDTIIATEGCKHHADPEDDGGGRLLQCVPNAVNVYRVQQAVKLEGKVTFLERTVANITNSLAFSFPSGLVGASYGVALVRATKTRAEGRPA